MGLTANLWHQVSDIFARILAHPFLQGLTSGSLDEEIFRFYVVQDSLYLRDFARGLAMLAARAPEDEWLLMFAAHGRDAILVERSLHESFFKEWHLPSAQVYATPMTPTNLLYTSYLLRVAYQGSYAEAVGAFLPCYWIYWEVGKELEKRGSPHPLYRRWIELYASDEFGDIVSQVLAVVDRLGRDLSESKRELVRQHFVTTSKLEFMFWDMAFRREEWPL